MIAGDEMNPGFMKERGANNARVGDKFQRSIFTGIY